MASVELSDPAAFSAGTNNSKDAGLNFSGVTLAGPFILAESTGFINLSLVT